MFSYKQNIMIYIRITEKSIINIVWNNYKEKKLAILRY